MGSLFKDGSWWCFCIFCSNVTKNADSRQRKLSLNLSIYKANFLRWLKSRSSVFSPKISFYFEIKCSFYTQGTCWRAYHPRHSQNEALHVRLTKRICLTKDKTLWLLISTSKLIMFHLRSQHVRFEGSLISPKCLLFVQLFSRSVTSQMLRWDLSKSWAVDWLDRWQKT